VGDISSGRVIGDDRPWLLKSRFTGQELPKLSDQKCIAGMALYTALRKRGSPAISLSFAGFNHGN
jgi:hypothetical protein